MNQVNSDRRHGYHPSTRVLKLGINDDQTDTLLTLERFGWSLKFVRATPAGALAVVHDPDKNRFALIEPDGELNEDPPTTFRD